MMTGLFESQAPRPLADRLRPSVLGEVVGQDHLLKEGAPLGRMVAGKRLASMVLWGPPGCGKTTIARLLADVSDLEFEPLSAVFSGVADLRKVFERAKDRRLAGRGRCFLSTKSTASTGRSRTAFCPMLRTEPSFWWAPRRKTPPSN